MRPVVVVVIADLPASLQVSSDSESTR